MRDRGSGEGPDRRGASAEPPHGPPAAREHGALSARDRAVLDFERDWRAHRGRKGQAIREQFGVSAARYHQLLARLLDSPAAAAYDPLVVARLRRRRDRRVRAGVARTLGQRGDG